MFNNNKVIIGCPVYKRAEWLPLWFEAIENQTFPLKKLGFVFVIAPDDDETIDVLIQWHRQHPEVKVFDLVTEYDEKHEKHPEKHRPWTPKKYFKMVNLRNRLLDQVRCHSPARFFSLDSDIIIDNPNTIQHLYDFTAVKGQDAAAPWCHMFPYNENFPNVMSWGRPGGAMALRKMKEYPIGETFQAEIIMAAVMMSKEVYENVNYRWHRMGEDLGWSTDATRKGYKLYSVSNIYASHLMHKYMIDDYMRHGRVHVRTEEKNNPRSGWVIRDHTKTTVV